MKKFLSLVLALIMTMSLVTIGAGATEYRDLTDKDEIQYEEAVAVLNRIGVITGYEDGSFRPETELTRGAAAKIIVSLLIGPEAASNLPNATAPYPDVPASHTFAGVISYCKTAGIISGYGDGTFKPGNSLTGFAFAKMLLGALGYKSEIEGFVDTGWTMNVARVGNVTGLFDRLDFDGSASVNREEACQLALNTLKATMVTYGGTTLVTGAQTLAVQGTQAMYVTSNNREINANINRRVINATNNEMTLEFGEEHFKDLRLEHDKYDPAYDDFGHPSNEWSWKKVTIGTFKLPADFTFTKQMSHREDTDATKEKALGLRGYDTWSLDHRANYTNWSSASSSSGWRSPFDDATQITLNGWNAREDRKTGVIYDYDASTLNNLSSKPATAPTLSEIADLTDNGVTVEVYVCPVDADYITNVVVTRTQLMKVKRVGSDYVTLEDIEPDSRGPRKDPDLAKITGYNAFAIDCTNYPGAALADVKDSNYDAYNVLKDMKVGDRVAVVPYTTDNGKTWEVGEAYAPETVSGAFTKVDTYANVNKRAGSAVAITVGGTSYPINEWNKDMLDVKGNEIKATKKDVTLYLAKDGTVLWADEIGNSDDWMVVGDYYQATGTNGKVGWYVHGWTTGGDEVDLDLGTIRGDAERYAPGELVHYYIAEDGNGEYALEKPNYAGSWLCKDGVTTVKETPLLNGKNQKTGEGVYEVSQYTIDADNTAQSKQYKISKRNGALALEGYNTDAGTVTTYTTAGKPTGTTPANPVKRLVKTGTVDAAHDFSYANLLYDGVKFIFVNFDAANGEVETIDFKSGVQDVEYSDLVRYNDTWKNIGTNGYRFVVNAAEAYVNDKGVVKAVVVKADSSEADLSKIAVITDTPGDRNNNTGAEGDRVTGLSYAKQYVTGPNFNISEEKTGYFDKDYPIGTILVISEKDNIIVGKYFHSTYYNNGNPDAVYVRGITQLTRPNGGKSEAGFLIGQDNSTKTGKNAVWTLNGKNALTETGNDVTVVPDGTGKVDLLGNQYVSGFDTDVSGALKGLVRVDSSTKFIDLRAINNDTIDNLGDLLDYDLDTVELRVLVDGAVSTDLFRHAYVVIVEKAVGAKQVAKAPVVDVTAMDGGVKVPDADITVTAATAIANKKVTITAPAGDTVTLGASVTGTGYGTLSAFTWKNAIGQTISAPVSVVVPASPNEATFTVSVTNTDNDKKDQTTATTVVDIVVKAKTSEGPGPQPGGSGSVADKTTENLSKYGVSVDTTKSVAPDATGKFTVAFSNVDYTKAVDGNRRQIPADNAGGTLSFDVCLKGSDTVLKSDTTSIIAGLGRVASKQVTVTGLEVGDDVEIKVTGIAWDTVKVYYDYTGKYAELAKTAGVKATSTSSVKVGTYSDSSTVSGGDLAPAKITVDLNVTLPTTAQGALNGGNYTITATNFTNPVTTNASKALGTAAELATSVTGASKTVVAGNAPVVVTINTDALTVYDTTLNIAGVTSYDLNDDFSTLKDGGYTVTTTPASATVGASVGSVAVDFSGTIDAIATGALQVTLAVVDANGDTVSDVSSPIILKNKNGALTTTARVVLDNITASGTVKVVSATPVAGPTFKMASGQGTTATTNLWKAGDKISIFFNEEIDDLETTFATSVGGTATFGTGATVAKGTATGEVVVTLGTGASVAADNTVILKAGMVQAKNAGYNAADVTVVLTTTGIK